MAAAAVSDKPSRRTLCTRADLPSDKRRQAARRIAGELDRLEQAALDVAIPDGTRGGTSA